jgi:sporulation protein YlmC with PRC-barrel domain
MKKRLIHAERLLGRSVLDIDNKDAGRIEEIEIEQTSEGAFVTRFVLGQKGLLKRLSFKGFRPLFVRSRPQSESRHSNVPWEQMDLSRPKHPRLRCRREEL